MKATEALKITEQTIGTKEIEQQRQIDSVLEFIYNEIKLKAEKGNYNCTIPFFWGDKCAYQINERNKLKLSYLTSMDERGETKPTPAMLKIEETLLKDGYTVSYSFNYNPALKIKWSED